MADAFAYQLCDSFWISCTAFPMNAAPTPMKGRIAHMTRAISHPIPNAHAKPPRKAEAAIVPLPNLSPNASAIFSRSSLISAGRAAISFLSYQETSWCNTTSKYKTRNLKACFSAKILKHAPCSPAATVAATPTSAMVTQRSSIFDIIPSIAAVICSAVIIPAPDVDMPISSMRSPNTMHNNGCDSPLPTAPITPTKSTSASLMSSMEKSLQMEACGGLAFLTGVISSLVVSTTCIISSSASSAVLSVGLESSALLLTFTF
mmetsp:Transcript_59503/g.139285  ORF Transcript_59503/g.139285 Transcript_59503/m.139285 type:complete len:261 (-) Transcript_59503:164-946(-)